MQVIVNSVKKLVVTVLILIAVAAGTLLLYDSLVQTPLSLPNYLDEAIRITIIAAFWLTILFFISRSKPVIAKHFGDRPASVIQAFLGSIAVLVMIFALLRVLGVSPESLLTGAGIVSITIGLIMSTFVGSLLNGALVFATLKLRTGDTIIFNNIPGRVIQITALATRIKTDIGEVAIPNSALASGSIIITKIHPREAAPPPSRLPYALGDKIITTYIKGEGTVKELTPIHTKVLLDSGKELLLLNSSILSGTVAVAKISSQERKAVRDKERD